jgi:hypothetical protein
LQAAEKVWAHRYGGEILEMKALAHIAWKQQKTKENAEPEIHPDVQHVATHLKRTYRSLWLLAALLVFLTFFVATAHCQFSKIKSVSISDGTNNFFSASPFKIMFSGCSISPSGSTVTVSCAGAAANPGGSNHQIEFNANGIFGGIPAGTAGQVLCSNGTTSDPAMCDPVVSGPDAPGVAPTKPPVQVGLFDGTNIQRVLGSSAGRLSVDVNSAPTTPVTGTFFQATQPVSSLQLPAALDGSGFLKTHEQGTAAVSAVSLPLPSNAAQETGGNLATLAGIVSAAKAAVKTADGDQATLGAKADAKNAATDTTAVSAISLLKEISSLLQGTITITPSGTITISGAVTQSGTWTVQPGNTANTTAWKVDNSGVVQPISASALPLPTGAATSANQCGGSGPCQVSATASANASGNPIFTRETDGTNPVILDPCRTQANIFKPISQTASAQLVTGTSAKKIYICSINLVTAAANNVAMVEGTGTVCATGIAGMAGGSTAATGWNFAANGGLTQGNGMGSIMAEATNADNLCLLQSAAVQLSGSIGYVVQ